MYMKFTSTYHHTRSADLDINPSSYTECNPSSYTADLYFIGEGSGLGSREHRALPRFENIHTLMEASPLLVLIIPAPMGCGRRGSSVLRFIALKPLFLDRPIQYVCIPCWMEQSESNPTR